MIAAGLPFSVRGPARRVGWIFGAWGLITIVAAIQGYLAQAAAGTPEPWQRSLAYAALVYLSWAALTPLTMLFTTWARFDPKRLVGHVPVAIVLGAVHSAFCIAVFWTAYPDIYGIMADPKVFAKKLIANLHIDILIYAVIVLALTAIRFYRDQRQRDRVRQEPTPVGHLTARHNGRSQVIPLGTIRWIAAAGNYAEVTADSGVYLLSESLTSLENRLPAEAFARVHRSAIVRLDRIKGVQLDGHGDGTIQLNSGTTVRLSRRYRQAVDSFLQA